MESPKKTPLPSQDEARRANVLMEQMLSKFDAFGESLSIVRERVDRIEPKLDRVADDVELLKSVGRSQSKDLRIIKSDVAILKSDVGDIKVDLQGYNRRLEGVETKLAS